MPFNIKASLESIHSKVAASGYFQHVQIGEPKSPPGEGMTAALYMREVGVTRLYLDGGTEELHQVGVRIYTNMLSDPEENIEYALAEVVSQITNDLIADYQLGGEVREIDIGGIHGAPLRTAWGYVDVGGKMYRIADIFVPLSVDDSATAAP